MIVNRTLVLVLTLICLLIFHFLLNAGVLNLSQSIFWAFEVHKTIFVSRRHNEDRREADFDIDDYDKEDDDDEHVMMIL